MKFFGCPGLLPFYKIYKDLLPFLGKKALYMFTQAYIQFKYSFLHVYRANKFQNTFCVNPNTF